MDFESVKEHEGESAKITLINNFWYRAKIISCTEKAIKLLSEDGKNIVVEPQAIIMIIPI